MRFSIGRVALAAAALAMLATPGLAQQKEKTAAYPDGKTIEMVALFGAASASTTTARELAKLMEKSLGAPVVIADKPGAGGAKGYIFLSQQKPDGYSIVWSSNSISTTFHSGQLPFDYKELRAHRSRHRREPGACRQDGRAVEDAEGADGVRQGQP